MNLFSSKIILTVSRLTNLLKETLEENFEQVWLEGEVSNFATPSSGHLYFTIKDAGAMLRCVMFRSSVKAVKFRIEEGMALILRGRISIYEQRGEYQLIAEYAEPKGIGALQAAFIQLKERLAGEGLFDESKKQALPKIPKRIGIVTSSSGAAIHDILNVLGRRNAAVELLLYPVKVQGTGAAEEIAAAIDDLNALHAADVLIVGRGGGSLEDLWAFNEEVVARAIYRSKIPVISAVGHETDWTISDFTSDLRAATPSAAAELVCRAEDELNQEIQNLLHRLHYGIAGQLNLHRRTVDGLLRSLHDPSRLLGHWGQRIDDLTGHLDLALRNLFIRHKEQLTRHEQQLAAFHPTVKIGRLRQELILLSESAERQLEHQLEHLGRRNAEAVARLEVLSPLHTLARGFCVVSRIPDGKVIKNADLLEIGDKIGLRLHQGSMLCRVQEIYKDSGEKAIT